MMNSQNDNGNPGCFNYLDASVPSSLYRNGRVFTRRDANGNDSEFHGADLDEREVIVHNARLLKSDERCALAAHGFELLTRPLTNPNLDFFDQHQVLQDYYPQCVEVVQNVTGAKAYAFDHNIRSALGKKSQQRILDGQQVQGPAHVVHGDYTLTSAPQRLRDLSKPPGGNDTLRSVLGEGQSLVSSERVKRVLDEGARFSIINVWRNIVEEPVATHPLALCDGKSFEPNDLVVFEIHYQDRVGENYFAKHSSRHRWYYYPKMTKDEALLIKQWDSAGKLAQSRGTEGDDCDDNEPCTFSFHSAFEDPSAPPDAPDRWSIEVRCLVLYG